MGERVDLTRRRSITQELVIAALRAQVRQRDEEIHFLRARVYGLETRLLEAELAGYLLHGVDHEEEGAS